MRHKGIPVPGWEGGHSVGLRVALVLEEDGQVAGGHVP